MISKPIKYTVATYPGSGFLAFRQIFGHLGVTLEEIGSLEDARRRHLDAVLLQGGNDITPAWYGEENRFCQSPDKKRDVIEWTITRRAMNDGLPVLGICRGCQFLAVAAGGSLYQDILEQGASDRSHNSVNHLIMTSRILDRHIPTQVVNSYHHQSIRRVPDGFAVVGESEDGIVEAIHKPGYLGLQFHPEFMIGSDRRWYSVFEWLLDGLQ